jgi:ADP-ribose pyrophosphatase YjhB (NUDIX family)
MGRLRNKGPNHTVDIAIVHEETREVLLIQRRDGTWALPGGFIDAGEDDCTAALRELVEETNIDLDALPEPIRLDAIFTGHVYDPRQDIDRWVETSLFYVPVLQKPEVLAGDDAQATKWAKLEIATPCHCGPYLGMGDPPEGERTCPRHGMAEYRSNGIVPERLYADHLYLIARVIEFLDIPRDDRQDFLALDRDMRSNWAKNASEATVPRIDPTVPLPEGPDASLVGIAYYKRAFEIEDEQTKEMSPAEVEARRSGFRGVWKGD